MTWQKFQSEVAFLWKGNGENYDQSHAEEIKMLLQKYSWELGKMENKGKTRQEQIAFAWKMYKKEYSQYMNS